MKNCEQWWEYSVPLLRFRTSIPKHNIILNREIYIDLMWMNEKPVLNIVKTETGFQNATFIEGKTTESI